jgi:deazaflavin-dependent oxidoreductase (nitroreductase family)
MSQEREARFLHWAAGVPGSGLLSRIHGSLFRRTGGRFITWWFGAPVLTLQVKGRKSGKLLDIPLVYATHPDGWVVVAANGGAKRDPQWARNLRAAPSAQVHVGGRAHEVEARFLEGEEASAVRKEYEKAYPTVSDYEQFTDRELPVILLARG